MTKHVIDAEIEVKFHLVGAPDDEREVAYPIVRIEYSFLPGSPPRIHYDENDHPGWSDEIELISAKLLDGDGLAPEPRQVEEWAQDWLDDTGYELARRNAR